MFLASGFLYLCRFLSVYGPLNLLGEIVNNFLGAAFQLPTSFIPKKIVSESEPVGEFCYLPSVLYFFFCFIQHFVLFRLNPFPISRISTNVCWSSMLTLLYFFLVKFLQTVFYCYYNLLRKVFFCRVFLFPNYYSYF